MDKCNAELHIADDFQDNHATMRCQREGGHDGQHREIFHRGNSPVQVLWSVDDRDGDLPLDTTYAK